MFRLTIAKRVPAALLGITATLALGTVAAPPAYGAPACRSTMRVVLDQNRSSLARGSTHLLKADITTDCGRLASGRCTADFQPAGSRPFQLIFGRPIGPGQPCTIYLNLLNGLARGVLRIRFQGDPGITGTEVRIATTPDMTLPVTKP